MRVTFLLTGSGRHPIGGFKIVYEYANRLVQNGHHVTLIHPQLLRTPGAVRAVINAIKYLFKKIWCLYLPVSWFSLDKRVAVKWILTPKATNIPKADIIIATGWDTANIIARLPQWSGDKYYLIQHLETWASSNPIEVLKTWNLPLKKVVISKWLKQHAETLGQKACYVPNGLDFTAFGIDVPLQKRHPASVMLLNHKRTFKGTKDGLSALNFVKSNISDLQVILFGIPKKPDNLPTWVTYYRNPSQNRLRQLYNEASIFVAPSHTEGWGLTPCEAMMCGCAVVATDVGGHREFAIDEQTALVVTPGDINALSESVQRLIKDPKLRDKLSGNARQKVKEFSWDRAYHGLMKALTDKSSSE